MTCRPTRRALPAFGHGFGGISPFRRPKRWMAGLVVAFAGVLWPGPAVSEAPDAVGWWWKAQAVGLVPVPSPPTVPAGGLYVAGDPSGPFAVSAIRVFIPADTIVGPMVLRIASAQGTVVIRACPTTIAWGPEQGGQMIGAPTADCASAATLGQVDTAAGTVTFEVSPLVRDAFLNVVLLPQEGAVFSSSFEPPGPDTIALTPAPPPSSGDSGTSSETAYLEGPAFTETNVAEAPTSPVFEPPPSSAGPATTPTTGPQRRPIRRIIPVEDLQPASKSGRDRNSLIASFVFTGLGLLYVLLSRRPAGAATAPMAEGRGVGRFRRPRTGQPPPL